MPCPSMAVRAGHLSTSVEDPLFSNNAAVHLQYLSFAAPSSRWDIAMEYLPEDDSDDEDEKQDERQQQQ